MTNSTSGCWDDVKKLSLEAIDLFNVTTTTSAIYRNPEALKQVVNLPALMRAGEQLIADMSVFKNRLDAISSMHIGKVGGSGDVDENMHSINISEKYHAWISDYTDVILPTVATITELVNERPAEVIVDEKTKEIEQTHKPNRNASEILQSGFTPEPEVAKMGITVPSNTTRRTNIRVSDLLSAARGEK